MVVRVRQAMIVPHYGQGGAYGCMVASHLQSSRDLSFQPAAMEKRLTGGVENGRQGAQEALVPWQRAASGSSISSMDSLPAGDSVFSTSDMSSSLLQQKAKLGLHAAESDEEVIPESMQDDLLIKKLRRHYGSAVQPHPAALLYADEVAADQGFTPSDDGKDPSLRVKFMCSFGGKIFPRPSDGKLRYVGGDTKIIAVNRDLNFLELMAKMTEVYGEALTLKYQLPDEDLDALVSVSSDEDLENMMEEYDKLDADGSSRLRVFLFPAVDYDSAPHRNDSSGDLRNSEQRYVDAVNGISEVGSRNRGESYVGSAQSYPIGESYVGSAQSYPIDNLLCIDAPETWSMPRGQDPVAMVAPQGAHDVASHILRGPVAVPVSTVSTRPNVPSAPSSAPSSPPLLPRQALGKLVSDIHLQYHQDKHVKLGAQYNVLVAEGNYQENENLAGSGLPPVGGQQEPLYRSSDKQHDGGHQDHSLRAEQRRLPETKVPRVGSHGKLSRLAEHTELSSATNENQQLPDVLEMQRLLQQPQPQQSLHQTVWQHPMESHQESYRRPDLLQSTITQNAVLGQQQGYQQHQPGAFRAGLAQGLPSHETGYRQDQQMQYAEEVLHHISRAVSSHTMVSGVPTAQSTSYHAGSAPSSPRLGFREVPSRHAPGPQQVPLHWAFGGAAFAEQQSSYSRRMNYGDQSGRSFRVSNSPPKYRDHLVHSDERLLRQQQQALGNPEALHLEQIPKVLYENNPAVQPYDLLSRPQLPLYKGMNPFQEKPIPYQDHQEMGDSRRHQLPQQGKESQFLPGQQHMHSLHHNQRLDYHDPLLQQSEQLPGNPRYQETQLKVPEWDSEEARLGFRVRGRSGQLDDELHADSALSHHRELQQTGYPGLHLPETSDDLLSGSVADFTPVHGKGDRLDHSGSSGFQFRQGKVPPNAFGSHSGPKPRTNLPDSANMARYMTRSNEPDFMAAGGLRAGGNVQDPRSSIFDSNGHKHISSVVGQGLQFGSSFHRLEERPAPTAFNPIAQPLQNLRLGDNTMLGNDMRWNGGLGPDDVRIEVPNLGRDLIGSFYDDRLPGLPSLAMSRGSRLSRPPSSTNITNLLEEDRGGVAHLQTYSTQCRGSSLMDEDALNQYAGQNFRGTENLLFNSSSSRYAVPSSQVDTVPATSTGLFAFDPTPANSTSSDYHILVSATDLSNIKTTATQVPSIEGDDSSGSAHTTGGSFHSMSNQGSVEMLLGQLTMTQHLAEDVASCVLEPSPLKVASQEHVQKESDVVEDRSSWAIDTAPTFSPNLWENALDDAMLTNFKDGNNDENLEEEEDSVPEETEITASINKDEASEEVLVIGTSELEREGSIVKHSVEVEEGDDVEKSDVAAATAEAIAHGLQTIKNADLEELRELGSGTFGTVYHGKWRGTDVAIKRIKSSCFAGRLSEQDRLIADFWREACNLGHLHHPNVVAFYGVVADGPGGTLATVTEYMVNGSLKQVLQKKDRTIDRRKRLLIAMDSAFGMEYLHGKNIVHFDLKCENLLVNMRDPHRPICKVGDLGLSKVKHQTMVSGGVRGTLPWMAPELLNGSSSLVTEKVDVFSFGIVMWELLTGEEPYANMHYGAIIGGIVNNTLRPPIPTWCDPAWRTLMERCWSADTASRPSFSEVASELRAMSEGLKPKSQPQSQGQSPPLIQA